MFYSHNNPMRKYNMKKKAGTCRKFIGLEVHVAGVDAAIYLEQTTELPM